MRITKQHAIIAEILRGMSTKLRSFVQKLSLLLDIVPSLRVILVPKLRPINIHLYTPQERNIVKQVVAIMIDYNLNYIQERTAEGSYDYKLEPNIDELVCFGKKRALSYSNKQLIAREIEMTKMLGMEEVAVPEGPAAGGKSHPRPDSNNLPNHLRTLQSAKNVRETPPPPARDFFGRIVQKKSPKSSAIGISGSDFIKSDIWFQYKEGYSNAVRKRVKVSDLK